MYLYLEPTYYCFVIIFFGYGKIYWVYVNTHKSEGECLRLSCAFLILNIASWECILRRIHVAITNAVWLCWNSADLIYYFHDLLHYCKGIGEFPTLLVFMFEDEYSKYY